MKTKVKIKVKLNKPRNSVARSPLLRKGGAHQESRQTQRFRAKQNIQQALKDLGQHLGQGGDASLLDHFFCSNLIFY